MKTLCLRLPEATAARLAAAARQRSQSKSAVVRAILEEHLSQPLAPPGSCLELAADLVGRFVGPADLSTHKRHLRGYGR